MEKKNTKVLASKNIYNLMFLFVIIIEVVSIIFSISTGSFSQGKTHLLLTSFTLALIFKFKYKSNKEVVRVFASILLAVLLTYLLLYIFVDTFNELLVGLYVLELTIILNFSRFKLKNKLIIHSVFGTILLIGFMFFNLYSTIIENTSLYIIAFYLIVFIELVVVDRIINTFKDLIVESENHSKQILVTNEFLSKVLEKEEIYLIYYYPDNHNAHLITDNFPPTIDRYIPHFLDYIKNSEIFSCNDLSEIINAIDKAMIENSSSINIPVQVVESTVWINIKYIKMIEDDTGRVRIIISITSINDYKMMELKFKNALSKSTVSILEYNIKDDEIVSYSDSVLEHYFGGESIQNAQQTLINQNIIYFSDIDIYNKGLERVRNGENNVSVEIRIFPSPESSYSWVRLNFTSFKDLNNNPTMAWVTVENIAEAKSSEKWLDVERKKRIDTGSGLLAVFELNVSREFVINHSFNFEDKYSSKIDLSLDNIMDSFVNKGVEIDNKDDFYTRLSQRFLLSSYEKGKRVLEFKYNVISPSKNFYYISNITKLFFDVKTQEVVAFIFFYDITQSVILNNTVDSILQTKFVYWSTVNLLNSNMSIRRTQLYKVTDNEGEFRNYEEDWTYIIERFVHPEDREFVAKNINLENVKEQLKNKRYFSFEFKISDSGSMISKRRCYFIRAADNSPYVTILEENLTKEMIETIKQELVLKNALHLAEAADSAKSEFLSRISHEIRTPLSAIIGLSELGITAEKDEKADYFNKISDSGKYLLTLMNDILDMNKLELGKVKLVHEFVDTEKINKNVLTIVKSQAMRKNIELKFVKKGKTLRYQYLDKMRLQQILINILNNAIKYTPSGGSVTYTVNNIKRHDKYYGVHTIKDSGVGISEDFKKQVFNPFARERNLLSDTEGGTGLGLAICSNLVKQLKGDIEIESELNKGTTVTITLPITIATKDKYVKKIKKIEKIKSESLFSGKKVLVAEDQQINAMIITSILTKSGLIVDHVVNGEDAVRMFAKSKEGEYDVILLDIMMPILNGLDASKQIRALERKDASSVPIIALSANAFDEDIKESLKYGMNDHLKKPVEISVLLDTLKKFI